MSAPLPEERLTRPLRGWDRWRFLVSGSWIGWFLFACAVAVVCWMLGQWQFHRRDEVRAVNAKVTANYDAAPKSYEELKGAFRHLDPVQEWSQVRLTGRYVPEKQLIVRNRTNDGDTGYDVLVPFRTDSGDVVVIDRGWVPLASAGKGRPQNVPAPPQGTVTVVARLRPSEPALNRTAPQGQIATIELPGVARLTGLPVQEGAYGQLKEEKPAPATALRPAERPQVDDGTHLSYALQWNTFGILAFVGFGYAARRHAIETDDDREWEAQMRARDAEAEGEDETGEAGERREPVVNPVLRAAENAQRREERKRRRRRHRTDEDEEDALLEHWEG